MEDLKLNSEVILDKEFDVDIKGWNAKQVDMFLDIVAQDYETFERVISEYQAKINEMQVSYDQLKHNLDTMTKNQVVANENVSTEKINTLDILKRLSKLELEVYNNK